MRIHRLYVCVRVDRMTCTAYTAAVASAVITFNERVMLHRVRETARSLIAIEWWPVRNVEVAGDGLRMNRSH